MNLILRVFSSINGSMILWLFACGLQILYFYIFNMGGKIFITHQLNTNTSAWNNDNFFLTSWWFFQLMGDTWSFSLFLLLLSLPPLVHDLLITNPVAYTDPSLLRRITYYFSTLGIDIFAGFGEFVLNGVFPRFYVQF